jgi:hypothetical protein
MSARNRAIKRAAAEHQDALDLLAQGRRSGGLPGGEMTRRDGEKVRVEHLPAHSYVAAGGALTFHFGGGVSHG